MKKKITFLLFLFTLFIPISASTLNIQKVSAMENEIKGNISYNVKDNKNNEYNNINENDWVKVNNDNYLTDINITLNKELQQLGNIEILYSEDANTFAKMDENRKNKAPLIGVLFNLTNELAKQYELHYQLYTVDGESVEYKNGDKVITSSPIVGIKIWLTKIEDSNIVIDNEETNKEKENDEKAETLTVTSTTKESTIDETLTYQAHVSNKGWQAMVNAGDIAGIEDENYTIEALKLNISDDLKKLGDIEVSAHVSYVGWMDPISSDNLVGTTGKSQNIEALKINLTNELANKYNVYYRVYVQEKGWLGWAENGELAGSVGCNRGIDAIQIKLVSKDQSFDKGSESSSCDEKYTPNMKFNYQGHSQIAGWSGVVTNGEIAGVTGKGFRLEALKINLDDRFKRKGDIEASAHVSNIGWMSPVESGNIIGTTGQAKAIEGLKLKLTGSLANDYDIYYSTHVEGKGWLGWAKNGELSGSVGCSRRVEAIKIAIYKKGDKIALSVGNASTDEKYNPGLVGISYRSHCQDYGWMSEKKSDAISGTLGKGKRMEAFQFVNIPSDITSKGNITLQAHVQNIGWMSTVTNNAVAGTLGRGLQMEAIKLNLTSCLSQEYDIYYKVHCQDYGWLGWAKNGQVAGSVGNGKRIEAIQVVLWPKRSKCSIVPSRSYIPKGLLYCNYGANFAGRRSNPIPKGVVIHNTAGKGDTALGYFNSFIPNRVKNNQMNLGYTHYYVDRFNVVQVASTDDMAWHTANPDGNANYVGYEICDSYGNEADFRANEQACFKQVAQDMKIWGMKPTRSTVRLHREFYSTSCPHRSWDIHGKSIDAVKDYFISQINKYM